MEVLNIKKLKDQEIELVLEINGSKESFHFKYWLEDIFAVDFPEELRKILRPFPASVTQKLVKTLKLYLQADSMNFPVNLKTRKPEKLTA